MELKQVSVCEEKNFENIHKVQAKNLRNFLYYRCGDLKQAEDLMQEAFVRLWENCSKVSFEKVRSFLFTVGQRLLIDNVRHKKVELNFLKVRYETVNQQDPSFLLRESEFKAQLEKAISELPEIQREVFLMNRIDRLTYAQIAEALDIGEKAVEKRMHNALAALKSRIEELNIFKI
jgi:RNA polymerase sigma factor (sigma-70 family)